MSAVERLGSLLSRRLGVHPPRHASQGDLEARIEERRRALGLASVEAYLERVALAPDEELWHLAAAITNGWTWFFRDQAPLTALAERLRTRGLARAARIWVAGCSTGEEAYGVAIACLEQGVDARVVGTDVDAARIEIGRRGVYAPTAVRRVPQGVLARHFVAEDAGRLRVSDTLRARVELRLHNLLDPAIPALEGAGWDAILCRNVLLHCTDESVQVIVARLESALAPAGTLLLGASDPRPARASQPNRPPSARPAERASARPRSIGSSSPRSSPPPGLGPHPSVPQPLVPPSLVPQSLVPQSLVPPSLVPPSLAPGGAPREDDAWARAVALVRRGAHGEARDAIAALVAGGTAPFAAHATLGNLWLGAHRFDRAAHAYRDAERIEPNAPELWFLWGTLHRKRGAWAEAAAALRRALFLDDALWPARFLLAGAWERLGAQERCRHALEETLRSIERRPLVVWRSCVDELEGIACPPDAVRAMCLERLGRENEERKGARDGG